jgi:hypothetical protein
MASLSSQVRFFEARKKVTKTSKFKKHQSASQFRFIEARKKVTNMIMDYSKSLITNKIISLKFRFFEKGYL